MADAISAINAAAGAPRVHCMSIMAASSCALHQRSMLLTKHTEEENQEKATQ
jgi:hypothetical protein